MESVMSGPAVRAGSTAREWTGRGLTGLAVVFLAFDTVIKLVNAGVVVDSMRDLGYPETIGPLIGAIELACLALYLTPRSSLLGAVLFTGYLGGAVATHLRLGNPLLTHILFPVYVAALLWSGLYLRDERVGLLLRSTRR